MIEVRDLTKDYGTVVAVRGLDFHVDAGQVVGFLGPNGAGKTTTLRMIAGSLGPTSGTIQVCGHDVVDEPIAARRLIGYMAEASPLYPELRVDEYLSFRAALKGVARADRRARVERALERAGVRDMAAVRIGHLSKGYRQRVGLADALVADPPLLILDEPTAGLDPNQIREVRKLISELAEQHTILISTHILSEVETTCDRALVVDRGRLIAQGTIEELRAEQRSTEVCLVLRDAEERVEKLVAPMPTVAAVRRDGPTPAADNDFVSSYVVQFAGGDNVGSATAAVVSELSRAGVGVQRVEPRRASLEEVFSALTQSSRAVEEVEA